MSHKISDPKISYSQRKILFAMPYAKDIPLSHKTRHLEEINHAMAWGSMMTHVSFFFFSFPTTLSIGFPPAFYLMEADGCHSSKYPLYSKQEKRKNNGKRNS